MFISMTAQPRKPKGTPAGGQFDTSAGTGVAISLDDLDWSKEAEEPQAAYFDDSPAPLVGENGAPPPPSGKTAVGADDENRLPGGQFIAPEGTDDLEYMLGSKPERDLDRRWLIQLELAIRDAIQAGADEALIERAEAIADAYDEALIEADAEQAAKWDE